MFSGEVNDYHKLGNYLYNLRERDSLTIVKIASEIGVDRGTYRRWEKGLSAPDTVQLKQLVDKYGWDFSDYFS